MPVCPACPQARGRASAQADPTWDAIPAVLPDACSRADRVGARELGAGLVTESDVAHGPPCGQIADSARSLTDRIEQRYWAQNIHSGTGLRGRCINLAPKLGITVSIFLRNTLRDNSTFSGL
jgi:hypothetical protein